MRITVLVAALTSVVGHTSLVEADEPREVVEKALEAYAERNKVDRDELEPFALGLIPGTLTFRYVLPPVPHETPYMSLGSRYAFVIVDATTGNEIEIKATGYDHTICDSTAELFAAMKAAGVKVQTDGEATEVMRALIYLDIATRSSGFERAKVDRIKSDGRRLRPNTFEGGVFCWTRGDLVGLKVDEDGFATSLLGGHLK